MEIITIFQALKITQSLAGYFKVIETIDDKVEKLANSEFDAGIRALKQAYNSEKETESLFREARARFNKAIGIEKWERLALAHLGLSIAHFHLGDKTNSEEALIALKDLNFDKGDFIDAVLNFYSTPPMDIVMSIGIFAKIALQVRRKNREKKLNKILELQKKVDEYLNRKKAKE